MMNSSKIQKMSDSRMLYTPPRVVRISELRQGGGMGAAPVACDSGSGATPCTNGPQALFICDTGSGNFK